MATFPTLFGLSREQESVIFNTIQGKVPALYLTVIAPSAKENVLQGMGTLPFLSGIVIRRNADAACGLRIHEIHDRDGRSQRFEYEGFGETMAKVAR